MKNLLNKIKVMFKKSPKDLTDEQKAIVLLNESLNGLDDGIKALEAHVVALARLQFIHPESFTREAKNHKANTEYITKMLKAKKEE